jgi:hypothetical protein
MSRKMGLLIIYFELGNGFIRLPLKSALVALHFIKSKKAESPYAETSSYYIYATIIRGQLRTAAELTKIMSI